MTDRLRLLGALVVVAYHLGQRDTVIASGLPWLMAHGYVATDMFLALSGFSLARGYAGRRVRPVSFTLARLRTIWPAHVALLGVWVVVVLAGYALGRDMSSSGNFTAAGLVAQVLLIQAWGTGLPWGGWNGPTWTISALVPCFLLFPLMRRNIRRGGWVAFAGLLCLSWHFRAVDQGVGVLRALPLFGLGVSLAYLLPASVGRRRAPGLARWSLGIYLTHWLGVQVLADLVLPGVPAAASAHWAVWVLAIVAAAGAGWVFGKLMETPNAAAHMLAGARAAVGWRKRVAA